MPTPDFARVDSAGTILLKVRVHPGARTTGISGTLGDALKVELQSPPVDGKANAALLRFVAEKLRLPRAAVTLKSGTTGRDKVLAITGTDVNTLSSLLDGKK